MHLLFVLMKAGASEKKTQGSDQKEHFTLCTVVKNIWQMKFNISSLIKEIKKNVEGRSKSCCFMSLHGNTVKERKMLPLNPDVFPRKEGVILVSGAPLVQLCLTIKSLVMPEMRIALRFPKGTCNAQFLLL